MSASSAPRTPSDFIEFLLIVFHGVTFRGYLTGLFPNR
jgi:hypothetical protein